MVRRKGRSSSPTQNSKVKADGEGETSSKASRNRDESFSDKREQNSVPLQVFFFLKKKTSCRHGHPPVCQNYKSETGCICGRKCFFRHVEAEENPSKKSKKDGAKGSVALLKDAMQLRCVSQDSYHRISILQEQRKMGSKHAVNLSKSTWHQIQKFGKARVHRE